MAASISLSVNGAPVEVQADPGTPLLWVLRDHLNLTGTKFGCGIAACGACTVLIDGQARRSCVTPVGSIGGSKVSTIEASGNAKLQALQSAWIARQVPQCGYCQSGMLMAALGLLETTRNPSDAQIDAAIDNICRCGTYQRVRAAIHAAAAALADSPLTPSLSPEGRGGAKPSLSPEGRGGAKPSLTPEGSGGDKPPVSRREKGRG